jgi:hypothetical protein
MMSFNNLTYPPLLRIILLALISSVQSVGLAQKIEIGAGVGTMNYTGDMAPQYKLRFSRPAASAFFRYNISKPVSFRAEIGGGGIKAEDRFSDDPQHQARNLSFKSPVMEGNLAIEYNFLDYVEKRSAINWTPYLFGGLGYMMFKPSPQTGNYSTNGMVIPFGVGVKYLIKRPWSIGVEFGSRKTFTDYLDNLGTLDGNLNPVAQGDPSTKDMYHYLRFSVSYTFYKIVCKY